MTKARAKDSVKVKPLVKPEEPWWWICLPKGTIKWSCNSASCAWSCPELFSVHVENQDRSSRVDSTYQELCRWFEAWDILLYRFQIFSSFQVWLTLLNSYVGSGNICFGAFSERVICSYFSLSTMVLSSLSWSSLFSSMGLLSLFFSTCVWAKLPIFPCEYFPHTPRKKNRKTCWLRSPQIVDASTSNTNLKLWSLQNIILT